MEEKRLRNGITTGTCAAAAASAAARMLLAGEDGSGGIGMMTPKGTKVHLPLFYMVREENGCSCAVQKDAGDDPDITDGVFVYASVSRLADQEKRYLAEHGERIYTMEPEGNKRAPLYLDGGAGVGVVTKRGLSCPVGKTAMNPVPRRMIFEAVDLVRQETGCDESLLILIQIPEGEVLAKKTFNPRLGIVGGLSILGTTGIVEPMSEAALLETIRLELHMRAEEGRRGIIITPGNYGERFLMERLGIALGTAVQCSNFVYDAVRMAKAEGMENILFVGHIGKLIKVAGGIKNTHSRYGDRRMEILWDCTRACLQEVSPSYLRFAGCSDLSDLDRRTLEEEVLASNTTEEAAAVLKQHGLLERVMKIVVSRICGFMAGWLEEEVWDGNGNKRNQKEDEKERNCVNVQCVLFSLEEGILGISPGAEMLIESMFK